jgi:hypothetical protein
MDPTSYTLFKAPVQSDTLAIVHYLHSLGKAGVLPRACVERNWPAWVLQLPSIETCDGRRFVGLHACTAFFESAHDVPHVLASALAFKAQHPGYRVR